MTSSGVTVPGRADARRNHHNLLVVAREVFAEQGAQASLRDVARRAGVAIGTLYRHFPNRDALLEAVLREGFLALGEAADALLASDTPREALLDWMTTFSSAPGECRGLPETMLAALGDETSALHAPCRVLRDAAARLLARAQELGEVHADVTGDDLFAALVAMRWVAENADAERAERLRELVGRGLGAPQ
ncbi:MAG: helix-turn-helix domain-containing protein [Actinophytocola sp.]|uniref:TetR/AcrR family transcriptional regulator n=1 Tax=Actinophytocola sp. TaxID=1872138 RepID=UPI003C7571B0